MTKETAVLNALTEPFNTMGCVSLFQFQSDIVEEKQYLLLLGYGLWCSMPFSTTFHYIMAVSFIGGGNWNAWRKTWTLSWQGGIKFPHLHKWVIFICFVIYKIKSGFQGIIPIYNLFPLHRQGKETFRHKDEFYWLNLKVKWQIHNIYSMYLFVVCFSWNSYRFFPFILFHFTLQIQLSPSFNE